MKKTVLPLTIIVLFFSYMLVQYSGAANIQHDYTSPSLEQEVYNQANADTIRILNYNIRYGRGIDDVLDLRRIAEIILETDADIAALQEVDVGVERSFRFDIMKILSGYTGMEPVFYKNIPHQGGEYGNGTLSRHPVISSRNYHFVVTGGGEQRGLLQAEIDINGQKIALMNTHLDHRPDETQRLMSVDQIIETKRAYRGMPVLAVGDFNDTPGSQTHLNMKEYFEDVWELLGDGEGYTFRSDNPHRRIDYIFFTNNLAGKGSRHLRPVSIEVLDTQASDHLPILVTFVLE